MLASVSTDLISRIGWFLDCSSRRQCLEASKQFKGINYGSFIHLLTFKPTNISKIRELCRIFKHIKSVAPSCKCLKLRVDSIQYLSDEDAEHVLQAGDAACDAFARIDVEVYRCPNAVIATLLGAMQKTWNIYILAVQFMQTDVLSHDVVAALMNTPTFRNRYVMYTRQIGLLRGKELMSRVDCIKVLIDVQHPIHISFEHLEHCAEIVVNVMSSKVSIGHAHCITQLFMTDMIWESDDALLRSFVNLSEPSRLKFVDMSEKMMDVKSSHTFANFWYRVIEIFPKTCNFAYMTHIHNVNVIPKLKRMLELGAKSLTYHYYCQESYLISKVVKRLVPGVHVAPYTHATPAQRYVPSNALTQITEMKDVYEEMSPDMKAVWHWLAYM